VLIISTHQHAQAVVRTIQAGARGYLSKEASPAELVKAIETVGAGDSFFATEDAEKALNQFVKSKQDERSREQLTRREVQVLVAIAEGLGNKETASRLGISIRTIEAHRGGVMRKLKIHTIAGLTKFAITQGLTAPLEGNPGVL